MNERTFDSRRYFRFWRIVLLGAMTIGVIFGALKYASRQRELMEWQRIRRELRERLITLLDQTIVMEFDFTVDLRLDRNDPLFDEIVQVLANSLKHGQEDVDRDYAGIRIDIFAKEGKGLGNFYWGSEAISYGDERGPVEVLLTESDRRATQSLHSKLYERLKEARKAESIRPTIVTEEYQEEPIRRTNKGNSVK